MKNKTFVIVGIFIAMLFVVFGKNTKNNVVDTVSSTTELVQKITDSQDVCPIETLDDYSGARVNFLPVSIESNTTDIENEVVGTIFDPIVLGKDLYKLSTDKTPWIIDEVDIDSDSIDEQVYYGNVAMNHTPHLAYIIKDDVVIFAVSGVNIWISPSIPNGIEVNETMDWNVGKYKTTKYEYKNGNFMPLWYQISCDVKKE